ncbi:carbohydrate sulfotransferase 11 isoform X2 [Halyomorpha halys]|uniref:carbohydrate sulfotransferase 11 isoform X2 n=1 Tax=Halyomorpha halys TaxID=286706 RepID=UPI0006D50D13|nr:carbohydrate sulfotransferase 11-like isoform X1 [Halyomorpha halys]
MSSRSFSLYKVRVSSFAKFLSFVVFTLLYVYFTYNAMPEKKTAVVRNKNITWKIIKGFETRGIDLYAMEEEMASRRELLSSTCQKFRIQNQNPKVWEYIIDAHHSLVWCKVHKAASDTWVHYFNILGGYNEGFLRKSKKSPMTLLRAKFPTPTLFQLQSALRNSLSFIIVRDPLERLLSTYLSLIEPKNEKYYSKLKRRIKNMPFAESGTNTPPTFMEFVKYVLDNKEDEYWGTTNQFCTPCMINFTVIVKLETLLDDQEYILKRAGLEDILNPTKVRIHYLVHEKGRTRNLLPHYYQQLNFDLLYDLANMYQVDYDMFGYNITKYFMYLTLE